MLHGFEADIVIRFPLSGAAATSTSTSTSRQPHVRVINIKVDGHRHLFP